jgi:hypothetical protein
VRGAAPAEPPRGIRGTVPRSAAASLLLPGLGQLLQKRHAAAACNLIALAALYLGSWHLREFGVPPLGALLALTVLSAADAARAERVARRSVLRVV